MLAHPNCDYASFPFAKFHDGNKDFLLSAKKEFNIVKQKDILPSLLRVDYPFTVWSNIYRMSSVSNLRWDERVYVYQDFDFMVNCALMNLRHDYCNSPVDYYYRLFSNGDNVCGNFVSQQKCDSTLYLFNKVLLKLETREDEKYLKRCYTDFILKHIERLMADNKKEETDRFIKMLSAHYPCFYITRLRLTYRIASHFTSFAVRRNLLFTLFVILFFKFNYISRIFAHFSR